jgi:long-chain acyl-CoA synthetase
MLLEKIANHASARRMDIALQGSDIVLTYRDLNEAITALAKEIAQTRPIALAVQNHPAWVVVDLAAFATKTPLVPLPHFFTESQLLHATLDAGCGVLITDEPARFDQIFGDFIRSKSTLNIAGKLLMRFELNVPAKPLPQHTAKITYTSGTTGNPKGVCLGVGAMLNVAQSIAMQANIHEGSRHLCVLPLATLLENVAGVYATLLAGGTVHLLPSDQVGLQGSSLNVQALHHALLQTQANTAIFIPALLSALVSSLEAGAPRLQDLEFLAVGGAHVPRDLLARAQALHLPVFEGYGLSECASVVALNTTKENLLGSVGKPLLHAQIKLAEDNEILVKGAQFLGYTGELPRQPEEWLATGDIGHIDEQGFLHIQGRKKNMFITSFGRNVSPEWVETELQNSPHIAQACVFGEAKPWNTALIVLKKDALEANIHASIEHANKNLPDYAQIKKHVIVAPFSVENGQLTPNGRLKRDAILRAYHTQIETLYEEKV